MMSEAEALAQAHKADGIVEEACVSMDRAGVPMAAGWLAFLRFIVCSAQSADMPHEEFITRVRWAWDDTMALRKVAK